MREPGEVVTAAFPRPGRALKGVLATLAAFALLGAILDWIPNSPPIMHWLVLEPGKFPHKAWALFTTGLVTLGFSHALWSLVGLYFFTTDLERRWGGGRLVRFMVASVVLTNLVVIGVSKLAFLPAVFHPPAVVGPSAAIAAIAVAWAKENRHGQMRFFFFLPMSGRTFFWISFAIAFLVIVFQQPLPEGVIAPLAGCLVGLAFGGTPSPARSLWLKVKLGLLRRRGESLKAELARGPTSEKPRSSKRGGKQPPLRVVYGGLEEDLKNRKPPKDKRYLN